MDNDNETPESVKRKFFHSVVVIPSDCSFSFCDWNVDLDDAWRAYSVFEEKVVNTNRKGKDRENIINENKQVVDQKHNLAKKV